jgi:hypothetical protein
VSWFAQLRLAGQASFAKPGRSRELRLASHTSLLRDTKLQGIGAGAGEIRRWPIGGELFNEAE